MKKTVIAVLLFITVLIFATYSAYGSEPDNGVRVSLGYSVVNSNVTVGEFGYEYRNWEVAVAQMGHGWTKRGDQDLVDVYSISHVVRPEWRFLGGQQFYRIGAAYVDGSSLVGNTNYRLGFGLEYKLIAVEYFHYSSANIHETNSGLDGVLLRLKLPDIW